MSGKNVTGPNQTELAESSRKWAKIEKLAPKSVGNLQDLFFAYYHLKNDIQLPRKRDIEIRKIGSWLSVHCQIEGESFETLVAASNNNQAQSAIIQHINRQFLARSSDADIDDFIKRLISINELIKEELSTGASVRIDSELKEEIDRMKALFYDLEIVHQVEEDLGSKPLSEPPEPKPLPAHFGPLNLPRSFKKSESLPIHVHFSQIMESIFRNPITILVAETGAGKSTQIPRFILEYWKESLSSTHPKPCVMITQPRRIAATSVARRVANERGERIGANSAIGYSIRFQSVLPQDIRNGSASMLLPFYRC